MKIVSVGSAETVPVTDAPPPVSQKVEPAVMVDESIASLKVAATVEAMATLVVPLVGVTAETVGTGPPAVVKDHELTLAMALPVAPTTPVVTAAVYVLLAARGACGVSVAVKVVAL